MMQVRDQRFEILSIRSFPECDDAQTDKKELCEEQRAIEQGLGKEIASYYEFYNRCKSEMLQCTARLEEEAVEKMKLERTETRYRQLTTVGKSESALVEALTAKQGVDYLRSTLPPREDGACLNMKEVLSCLSRTKASDESLQAELRKEDAEFDETIAASMYQDTRQAEAECYEPEYSCLTQRAGKYGGTPETLRALKLNIEVIKQRERLSLRVAEATVNQCKHGAVAQHQKAIVSAYTTYAKQPVLFFRRQLHRAFLKMHEDQVACLRGQPAAAAATEPSTPHLPPPKKPAKQPQPQPQQQPAGSLLQAKR